MQTKVINCPIKQDIGFTTSKS